MSSPPVAIVGAGLVTSVGLTAPAACAAMRAGITNHTETRFMGADGEWIMAAQVPLEKPWRGRAKLVKMAAMAIREALEPLGDIAQGALPLLLCVAEHDRPGRLDGLDDALFGELETELGMRFNPTASAVVPQGRASVTLALMQARKLLLADQLLPHVLITATDSLLVAPTLAAYSEQERLLTARNSNGFVPGEGAGAVVISTVQQQTVPQLLCLGIGRSVEAAHLASEDPLRADGLTEAIKNALADAGCEMGDVDFRIADNSGEQYYFKEAALALSRTLRIRKEEFDLWHPADCIGEVGAAIGTAIFAKALAASQKAYARGRGILVHAGNDAGRRTAAVLRYSGGV
jgi:3-oxoacyl-[acyl-carrier-protein] synthase-1